MAVESCSDMARRLAKLPSQMDREASADFFERCSNSTEISDAIKEWLLRQDARRPFGLGWPIRRRLKSELTHLGFKRIKVMKMVIHEVFIVNGTSGTSNCRTEDDLKRVFKTIARALGFSLRPADIVISFARERFQAVLYLPSG